MGEYAEEMVSRLSNPDPIFGRYSRRSVEKWDYANPGECVWTTRDGQRLRFSDMTESHRTYALRGAVRKGGRTAWDTPTGRALIACGVSGWLLEELGVPVNLPKYPSIFQTNESEGVPK